MAQSKPPAKKSTSKPAAAKKATSKPAGEQATAPPSGESAEAGAPSTPAVATDAVDRVAVPSIDKDGNPDQTPGFVTIDEA